MMSDAQQHLKEAIEAFNYPEEMGEYVHDSVETLAGLKDDCPEGTNKKRIAWLFAELSKGYEREAGVGPGSPFTAARLSATDVFEAFDFEKKTWVVVPA